MRVLKIGGNELDTPGFLQGLAETVARRGEPAVLVHGGGRAIAALQERFALQPTKINGLRVTDRESLKVAEMALSGNANKRIVRALLRAGVDAVGLSGVDGFLLRCRRKIVPEGDLGRVGEIHEVRTELLEALLSRSMTVVLSPISLGADGAAYNVNADEAAAAVAEALSAQSLELISNVPGVLRDDEPLGRLSPSQSARLIEIGVISGGMIPKVRAALAAVDRGVTEARIVDLVGLSADGGTRFRAEATEVTEVTEVAS
jgi:acetylglutamate kinase